MSACIRRWIAVTLLVTAGTWADPLIAASSEASRSVRLGSAAEVIGFAEQALAGGDISTAEAAFRALLDDPSPEVRAEARFRLAKIIATAGRKPEAAVLLRRVVDDYPEAAPARLELAAQLNAMGHEDSALKELRALKTTDLPPGVARFVDRWSASLQSSKPFGIQVEFALAPNSNINNAPDSDTLGTVFGDFTFDDDTRPESGVGFTARGWAHHRFALGKDIDLVARAITDFNLYRHKVFNDISAGLSVGPEFNLFSTRFSVEAGVGQRWYGMQPYQRQLRIGASATRAIGSVSQFRADAAARVVNNKISDLEDGRGVSLSARFERALSPTTSLSAFVTADRFKAKDPVYSTRSWAVGLTAYRDIGRMTFSLGAELSRLEADDRQLLLPEVREDRTTRFSLGIVFRQFTFAGFAPVTRFVVERNRSTVEYYDFKRTRSEIGISRSF